jgi:molybdenum cofactor biosynthesis protein A
MLLRLRARRRLFLRRPKSTALPQRRPLPQGPSFADFLRQSTVPPPLESMPRDTHALPRDVLTDSYRRFHGYLRVSLTERCNLRCRYCMPAEGVSDLTPSHELLTTQEVERVINVFARAGASKVRLTGGEPTLRRDLVDICAAIKRDNPGVKSLGLTTNGMKLLSRSDGVRLVDALAASGVDSINISLDSLDSDTFSRMTRRPASTHKRVLDAIDACASLGLNVKVNCVVLRGENEHELAAFADRWDSSVKVRFIEWMPFSGNAYDAKRLVPYAEMRASLSHLVPLPSDDAHDTTKWWTAGSSQVGFITSMSEHFCGSCNRVRVTADGSLKTCLFGSDSVSLRDALRAGVSDGELGELIQGALLKKHFKHGGHENVEGVARNAFENRPMVKIGG